MLKRNCAHNGVKNVEIVQKAITSHTGTISFEVENDVSVSARVASPSRTKHPGLTTIEVEAVSFVDVFKSLAGKTIELIKLDCEGSEYDIIAQIDREMAGSIRALTFEIHNIDKLHNLESMVEKMHSLGYQVHTMKDIFGRRSLNHLLATY
jgi:FkbM family methyltransferase